MSHVNWSEGTIAEETTGCPFVIEAAKVRTPSPVLIKDGLNVLNMDELQSDNFGPTFQVDVDTKFGKQADSTVWA